MSCNKKGYQTRGLAKAKMKHFNHGNRSAKKIENVYWCEECQGYHLTSMPKKQSRNLTRKNQKKE